MKYIYKPVLTPVYVLFLILYNVLLIFFHFLWNLKLPSKAIVKEWNIVVKEDLLLGYKETDKYYPTCLHALWDVGGIPYRHF